MPKPFLTRILLEKAKKKKTILVTASVGIICLAVPVLAIFIDPIFILAMFKLRITNGTIIYETMMKETEAARLELYMFNASNAERFLSGQDQKLRVQEIGPFVYQEYRTQENIDFNLDAGVVSFSPHYRNVFLEDESVGRPEDIELVVPNVPYLSMTSYFSSSPSMIQSIYKMWVGQLGPKPIRSIDVHKFLWGYKDKIIEICKTLVPGLIYHDSIAIFDLLYDQKADYRVEMDITRKNKFQVRTVTKTPRWNNSDFIETKLEFQDTYEGAAFPPQMTPQTPVNIYRIGICKTLEWEYTKRKRMKFGADAFIYQLTNKTFANTRLCDSKGLCPQGVIDLSTCFYGVPAAITKIHLLDVDPVFQDRIDGLSPDREKHKSYILIEPKIGMTVETSLSLQLNLLLGDLRFMPDLAKFSDMMLPLAYGRVTLPELPAAAKNSLTLMYVTGPQILLGLEVVSCVFGLILIAYSIKLAYEDYFRRKKKPRKDKKKGKISSSLPLISQIHSTDDNK